MNPLDDKDDGGVEPSLMLFVKDGEFVWRVNPNRPPAAPVLALAIVKLQMIVQNMITPKTKISDIDLSKFGGR